LVTVKSKESNYIIAVKRNREFRLLLAGSFVSMLGSRVTTLAYPMLVLYLTGSPVIAGWAAFATTVPGILVYIPAGALVDRWDPGRAMQYSELGRGVATTVVLGALALERRSPLLLLLITAAVIESVLGVFSTLAERRYIRSLVEPDQESSALVHSEARNHIAVLIGRPLGGFLFGLWPALPFLADVTSFIFSTSSLGWIRSKRVTGHVGIRAEKTRPQEARQRHLGNEILVGLRWVRYDDFARVALPLSASTTLIAQALIMVFLAQAQTRHLSAVTLGIVLAASGVGGALGSVAAPRFPTWRKRRTRPRLQTQLWSWAAAFAFLLPSLGLFLPYFMAAAMVLLGFTGALSNIELDTYLIQKADEAILARVMSVGRLMSLSACAVGPVLGGILALWRDGQLAIFFLFIVVTGLAIISSLVPSVRKALNFNSRQFADSDREDHL
jgi:MFS family permease